MSIVNNNMTKSMFLGSDMAAILNFVNKKFSPGSCLCSWWFCDQEVQLNLTQPLLRKNWSHFRSGDLIFANTNFIQFSTDLDLVLIFEYGPWPWYWLLFQFSRAWEPTWDQHHPVPAILAHLWLLSVDHPPLHGCTICPHGVFLTEQVCC